MKKLYRHFLVLLVVFLNSDICLSISSGSQTSQNVVSTNPNSFYGYLGNLVYKQDSLGNTIWVKDFSGFICTQNTDSNSIQTITTNGKFIYLGAIQGHDSSNTGYYAPAIIVMDTNGIIVKIKYDQLSLIGSGRYFFRQAVPYSKTGGAWFFGSYSAGLSDHILFYKVDSSGLIKSFEVHDYSWNYFSKFSELNDSSFIAQTVSTSGLALPNHYVVKLDEFGNIEWSKRILNTGFLIECGTSGIDINNGNICLLYTKDVGTSNAKTEALLFNRVGNLLLQREWPDSLIHANGIFKNINSTFCFDDGQSLFRFDSLLIDPCLGLGVNPGFTIQNISIQSLFQTFRDTSSFIPSNTNPMAVSPITNSGADSTSQDYCIILSSDHDLISHVNAFNIFPNPVNNSIHINSNIKVDEFQISDMNGRIIKSGKFENELLVDDLEPGIYFLRIQDKDNCFVERFIKL